MKLAAVSIVKNEADIIEAFVRHTCAWVDRHLVFDHDSTDGTREILGRLVAEGLPLEVFTDDALGNLQQARSNHLTRRAAHDGADWVLPLDADEFLTGPSRATLEQTLSTLASSAPATLPLLNYFPTYQDDAAQSNPVLRLTHCKPGNSVKILVPNALARDPSVEAGKGSHVMFRDGQPIPEQRLPEAFQLAHFALRSPGQQAMRIALAELQRLSRGKAHAGLDTHYRLSFQTLMENPEMFHAISQQPAENLRSSPLVYLGGPLRYPAKGTEWTRVTSALLPYLEKLAISHGELLDRAGPSSIAASPAPTMRSLNVRELTAQTFAGRADAFVGYAVKSGLGPDEGPVPEALLPIFHWGEAPASTLVVTSAQAREARLAIEAISYADRQVVTVELNGTPVHTHAFQRTEQRERIDCALPLRAGENQLVLRYAQFIQAARDPRQLAVIFLSLRVV